MTHVRPNGVLVLLAMAIFAPGCDKSPPPAAKVPVEPTAPEPRWDPDTPVDGTSLVTKRKFVVVPTSAVCPTREQAMARDCGNSVEDTTQGTREPLGTAVTVVGQGPEHGAWKALRYQKAGTLPGWIAAGDVADRPKTDALEEFDKRSGVDGATDAGSLSAGGLAALSKGTLVRWSRTRLAKFGSFTEGVYVYLVLHDGAVAVELPPPSEDDTFIQHHPCLIYGDCLALSYVCDDTYCDEVSILARATGKTTDAPDDPEGEWTAGDRPIPLFELIALSDRFGAHAGREP